MPINKNATLRYNTLDKCFSNFGRMYFMDDLINACTKALEDFNGKQKMDNNGEAVKISKEQIFADIRFMKSEQGWSIELDETLWYDIQLPSKKRTKYYRYKDKNFSINKKGLTTSEIEKISDTLAVLSRFKGIPNMEWVEDAAVRLDAISGRDTGVGKQIVGFQENPYLKGLDFFKDLFNAILNERVLQLEYKSFKHSDSKVYSFHPYYLKEYNTRWFVLGESAGYDEFSIFALDRIIKIIETDFPFKPTDYDFEEHFEDIIGVSVSPELSAEKIYLQVHKDSWPYIETKPLHGSQKLWREGNTEDYFGIEIEVQINYELIANVLYRGSAIRVCAPEGFVEKIKEEIEKMWAYYI